jgi:hypothetical protein
MKKFYILAITFFPLLILHFNGISQLSTDWISRYNGPANKIDNAREITLDSLNNIYVTGTSQNKNGSYCIATVKYNNFGVEQWTARYTGPISGDNYPYALAADADGNVYVTGRSQGSGSLDIVTIKYGPSGSQLWAARYNGSKNLNDIPGDLKVDATGNVFVTGFANASVSRTGAAIVTLKYRPSDGLLEWFALYDELPNDDNPANREEGVSLALERNGNLYVTGKKGGSGMVTIKYNPSSNLPLWSSSIPGVTGRKVLVDIANNVIVSSFDNKIVKYSSDGALIWEANASLPSIGFWDMALDATGNVFVTGEYDGISTNHSDYVTAKYNSALGTEQWIKTYNGSSSYIDFARSIAIDGAGNIYVTGYTSVNNGSRNGGVNYGTIKYSNSGVQQGAIALYDSPDKGGGTGFGVITDAAGNIYVTGESATKATSTDFATIKYSQGSASKSSLTNLANENFSISKSEMRNYPNPFSKSTTIEYQLAHEGNVKLSVFDLSGHEITTLVNEHKSAGTYTKNFNTNMLSAGTYFYRIQSGEYTETKKLIILR